MERTKARRSDLVPTYFLPSSRGSRGRGVVPSQKRGDSDGGSSAIKNWKVRRAETVIRIPSRLKVRKLTLDLPSGRRVDDSYKVNLSPFLIVFTEVAPNFVIVLEEYPHGPRRVVLILPGGAFGVASELAAIELGFCSDDASGYELS